MAKKEKKISVSAFDNVMKTDFNNKTTIEWHGLEIEIKKTLSLAEAKNFIEEVMEACMPEGGSYTPELFEFAIRVNTLAYYTNLSISNPIEHLYDMAYRTDIFEVVVQNINNPQFDDITSAIYDRRRFILNTGINEINNRMNDVLSAFEDIKNNTESAFSGMSPETLSAAMSALASSGIDSDKIVKLAINEMKSGK